MEILPNCFYKVGDTRGLGWFKTHEDNLCKDVVKSADEYILPEGYIFKDENGNVINATKIVLEKKKPKYPKTYEECLIELIGDNPRYDEKYQLLETFRELLICRDAYWKIAGEEVGLGKSWESNFTDDVIKYCIGLTNCGVCKATYSRTNKILSFPTEDIRDAFYKNFKKEIEECKELL